LGFQMLKKTYISYYKDSPKDLISIPLKNAIFLLIALRFFMLE
jgi:hypothetical protein